MTAMDFGGGAGVQYVSATVPRKPTARIAATIFQVRELGPGLCPGNARHVRGGRLVQLDLLVQSVASPLQRLDQPMRLLSIIKVTSQLRQATRNRLVRGRSPVPDFVDKFLFCYKIGIAFGERNQDREHFGLGAFFLVAATQYPLARQNFPFPQVESVS